MIKEVQYKRSQNLNMDILKKTFRQTELTDLPKKAGESGNDSENTENDSDFNPDQEDKKDS